MKILYGREPILNHPSTPLLLLHNLHKRSASSAGLCLCIGSGRSATSVSPAVLCTKDHSPTRPRRSGRCNASEMRLHLCPYCAPRPVSCSLVWSMIAKISIHSPLAGRDMFMLFPLFRLSISIHSPLAGRDNKFLCLVMSSRFQSTRPSRGETSSSGNSSTAAVFQSTRPSRGETALMTGADGPSTFQSTRPSRGETHACYSVCHCLKISIHSPLAGRDHRADHQPV